MADTLESAGYITVFNKGDALERGDRRARGSRFRHRSSEAPGDAAKASAFCGAGSAGCSSGSEKEEPSGPSANVCCSLVLQRIQVQAGLCFIDSNTAADDTVLLAENSRDLNDLCERRKCQRTAFELQEDKNDDCRRNTQL